MSDKNFKGEIRVASRIVDYLSSGLYDSPAACLKELINNSFDADATRVEVFVKPDADRLIIVDDGDGMDRKEFEKHFSMISESHKRDDSDMTKSGRPKIGKIGIGFIAANEICNVMEIVSTKFGSSELLQVEIRFDLMREDPNKRRRGDSEIAKADYFGTVDETTKDSHFTQIFLKEVRGEAQEILARKGRGKFVSGKRSIYGKKPDSISKILKDKNIKTWSDFDFYSKNILQIGLNVPVRYHDNWLSDKLQSEVEDIDKHVAGLNFSLYIDGTEVRKPIVFGSEEEALINRFHFKGEHVSADGYFYAQSTGIKPQELRGLLIRIRSAGVGEYDSTFLGFPPSIGSLTQTWISGELTVDDRLEEAMNIDRRTLRIDHPAYVELQEEVHNYLSDLLKRVRTEIYGSRSIIRKKKRAKEVEKKIVRIATHEIAKVAPESAKEIEKAWIDSTSDESVQKKILRKFTVDQFYEIVVEVAKEVLPPKFVNEFIKRLTDRLRR